MTRHIQNPAIYIQALLNHIQAYSEPSLTLALAETCYIQNNGIFRTLPQLHPNEYSETVIFAKLGKLCVTLEIQNPGILIILEHSVT